MYFDERNHRILLRDGESVVSEFEYARRLITGDVQDNIHPVKSNATDVYTMLTGNDIARDVEDIQVVKKHIETTAAMIDFVLAKVSEASRYNITDIDRVELELEYFIRTENIPFIIDLIHLIAKFEEDGVVWGVGRGSSCASLLMYILRVTDIDPLKYDIPFSELSKEQ